jgi:type 1 glutamine amidotransferase
VPADGLLYVTQVAPYRDGPAGVHGVLDQSATAMEELAGMVGLGFGRVTDVGHLSDADLSSAAVVALFTIGETPWSEHQRTVLVDRVRSGASTILAVHSATDACQGWAEYGRLVGARFAGHPWTTTVSLDVRRPEHPAVSHLGSTWTWHDEVYLFADLRPDADVLLTARPEELGPTGTPGGPPPATAHDGYPLSWCFTEGAGRVFSTSLGHFPHAWEDTDYLRHLLGGLRWLRGSAGA